MFIVFYANNFLICISLVKIDKFFHNKLNTDLPSKLNLMLKKLKIIINKSDYFLHMAQTLLKISEILLSDGDNIPAEFIIATGKSIKWSIEYNSEFKNV